MLNLPSFINECPSCHCKDHAHFTIKSPENLVTVDVLKLLVDCKLPKLSVTVIEISKKIALLRFRYILRVQIPFYVSYNKMYV